MGASRRSCLQVSGTWAQKCVWNLRVGGVVRAGNVLDSNETFHNQKYLAQDCFTLLFHLGTLLQIIVPLPGGSLKTELSASWKKLQAKICTTFKSWWGSKSSKCFVLY